MTERPPRDVDVDVRFLLANERTLLAWLRTALTFLAVGAGVQQFGTEVGARQLIAGSLVVLACAAGITGTVRYDRADRAIRQRRLPHEGTAPRAIAIAVVLVSLTLLGSVIFDARG